MLSDPFALEKSKTNNLNEKITFLFLELVIVVSEKFHNRPIKKEINFMNIEKAFKLKAKILSKEKSIKLSNANELLAQLIGFSSYHEYKQSLSKNDGRHLFLTIHKNNPTFSELRIKSLLKRSEELGLSNQELFKMYGVENLDDMLKKETAAEDIISPVVYLLSNQAKEKINQSKKYNLINYHLGTGSTYLKSEIINQLVNNMNNRVLLVSKKLLEVSILKGVDNRNVDFRSDIKINRMYNQGELEEYVAGFDTIVLDIHDKILLKKIGLMNILKTKKMYVFFEVAKMHDGLNASNLQKNIFMKKYKKDNPEYLKLLDNIYEEQKSESFVKLESFNKNLGLGAKILKDSFGFLLLVNFYKQEELVKMNSYDFSYRSIDSENFKNILIKDKDINKDMIIVNNCEKNKIGEWYNKFNYVIKVINRKH